MAINKRGFRTSKASLRKENWKREALAAENRFIDSFSERLWQGGEVKGKSGRSARLIFDFRTWFQNIAGKEERASGGHAFLL